MFKGHMRLRCSGGKLCHTVSDKHFTGRKGGTGIRVRRIGKGLSRKERQAKRGSHENRYADFSHAPKPFVKGGEP